MNIEKNWMLLVLMLRKIAESKGISQQQIAELTGLKKSNVSRVFSLDYCPTMRTFLLIATAINVNFFFEDRDSITELNQLFETAMTELGRRPEQLHKP